MFTWLTRARIPDRAGLRTRWLPPQNKRSPLLPLAAGDESIGACFFRSPISPSRLCCGLVSGRRSEFAKDVELLVLRHQLAVLERNQRRPLLRPADRALLAALARLLAPRRRQGLVVTPQTLLRWHRELVRRKWTQAPRPQAVRASMIASARLSCASRARTRAGATRGSPASCSSSACANLHGKAWLRPPFRKRDPPERPETLSAPPQRRRCRRGPFELIYADPPWRLPGSPTSSHALENHYPTLPLEEIKAIELPLRRGVRLARSGPRPRRSAAGVRAGTTKRESASPGQSTAPRARAAGATGASRGGTSSARPAASSSPAGAPLERG